MSCSILEPPIHSNGLGNPQNPPHKTFRSSENMWHILARSFNLPNETPENAAVRKQINWFVSNPKYLQQMAEQSRPYLFYIYQQVRIRNLPAEVALLPMVESSYDPFAYSKAGAAGLWQMMPGTGSGFGLTVNWWYDGRRDIIASTHSALNYISYLGNFFNDDWLLALAAYDAGEGTIENATHHNLRHHLPTDFWHLNDLSSETKSYIPKLLALATIIKNPDEYPIDLPFIPNAPYIAQVSVGSQIDLVRAAKIADMTAEELLILNPGYNRWATDPDGQHKLLFPIDKAARFQEQLSHIPKYARVTWLRYQVKKGDSLISIARHFKTTVKLLQEVNHLKTHTIQIAHTLLIPTETSQLTKIVLNSERKYFSSLHKIPEIHLTNHIVKKGDTALSIAKRYHVTTKEIRFWNGLKSVKYLHPGQKLIMWPPHKRTVYHPHYTTYTIQSGDTLSGIAYRHHTHATTIKKLNHLKSSKIKPKMTLKIPPALHATTQHHTQKKSHTTTAHHATHHHPSHKTKPHTTHHSTQHSSHKTKTHTTHHATHHPSKKTTHIHKTTHPITQKTRQSQHITYRVKSGDNLIKIAKKLGVKTADLIRWNKIKNATYLKPKQTLVFYSPTTPLVKSKI